VRGKNDAKVCQEIWLHGAYNFLIKLPKLIVIISGEFVTERLSTVTSAESKPR